MNELFGFLRWQMHGAVRTISFYGFVLALLSIIMMMAGCPDPWPAVMAILSLLVIMFDLARVWYRISLASYRYEKDRIIHNLTKEHQ